MSFHKDLTGSDIHVTTATTYADIAARDADTLFNTDPDNVDKVVRVDSPLTYFILTSTAPTFVGTAGTGIDNFLDLTDTPSSYSGEAMRVVRVNLAETDLEFSNAGSGDVAGPPSATDEAVALFDGISGKILKDSGITLFDVSAQAAMEDNGLPTDIPAVGAIVLIASTPSFVGSAEVNMTVTSDGELIYTGTEPAVLKLDGNITFEPTNATKLLRAAFFRQDETRITVTFDNTTNEILETATSLVNDDFITFNTNAGTLPAEIRNDIVYFVVNQTTNTFQVSYTSAGSAIAFTDNGSGTNTYAVGETIGSAPQETVQAGSPRTTVPQALVFAETNDRLFLVMGNKNDSVNIIVSKAYLRVFK